MSLRVNVMEPGDRFVCHLEAQFGESPEFCLGETCCAIYKKQSVWPILLLSALLVLLVLAVIYYFMYLNDHTTGRGDGGENESTDQDSDHSEDPPPRMVRSKTNKGNPIRGQNIGKSSKKGNLDDVKQEGIPDDFGKVKEKQIKPPDNKISNGTYKHSVKPEKESNTTTPKDGNQTTKENNKNAETSKPEDEENLPKTDMNSEDQPDKDNEREFGQKEDNLYKSNGEVSEEFDPKRVKNWKKGTNETVNDLERPTNENPKRYKESSVEKEKTDRHIEEEELDDKSYDKKKYQEPITSKQTQTDKISMRNESLQVNSLVVEEVQKIDDNETKGNGRDNEDTKRGSRNNRGSTKNNTLLENDGNSLMETGKTSKKEQPKGGNTVQDHMDKKISERENNRLTPDLLDGSVIGKKKDASEEKKPLYQEKNEPQDKKYYNEDDERRDKESNLFEQDSSPTNVMENNIKSMEINKPGEKDNEETDLVEQSDITQINEGVAKNKNSVQSDVTVGSDLIKKKERIQAKDSSEEMRKDTKDGDVGIDINDTSSNKRTNTKSYVADEVLQEPSIESEKDKKLLQPKSLLESGIRENKVPSEEISSVGENSNEQNGSLKISWSGESDNEVERNKNFKSENYRNYSQISLRVNSSTDTRQEEKTGKELNIKNGSKQFDSVNSKEDRTSKRNIRQQDLSLNPNEFKDEDHEINYLSYSSTPLTESPKGLTHYLKTNDDNASSRDKDDNYLEKGSTSASFIETNRESSKDKKPTKVDQNETIDFPKRLEDVTTNDQAEDTRLTTGNEEKNSKIPFRKESSKSNTTDVKNGGEDEHQTVLKVNNNNASKTDATGTTI